MREKLVSIVSLYGFYLWPILAAVVVLVLLVKIDLPKLEQMNQVRQQLSGIQERLTRLSNKRKLLDSLNEEKQRLDLEKTSLVLPDGKDAPSILRTVESSATFSGVLIEELDLIPGKLATHSADIGETPNEIPIKVTATGTLAQINTFLGRITSIGRAMGIDNLDITFSEGSTSAKLRLALIAYFMAPNPAVGGIEAALPMMGATEDEVLTEIYQREIPLPALIGPSFGKTDLFK